MIITSRGLDSLFFLTFFYMCKMFEYFNNYLPNFNWNKSSYRINGSVPPCLLDKTQSPSHVNQGLSLFNLILPVWIYFSMVSPYSLTSGSLDNSTFSWLHWGSFFSACLYVLSRLPYYSTFKTTSFFKPIHNPLLPLSVFPSS